MMMMYNMKPKRAVELAVVLVLELTMVSCKRGATGVVDSATQDPSGEDPVVATDRVRTTPVDDLLEDWCDVIYTCVHASSLGTTTLEEAVDGCLGDQRSVYWQLVELGCEESYVELLSCQVVQVECETLGSEERCEDEWADHSSCWL